MTDHRLTDLRSETYRAVATETALRYVTDYPDAKWPRVVAANLLAEIDASRSLAGVGEAAA
jgi:hypothetical protein